jgi:hypothetical protein
MPEGLRRPATDLPPTADLAGGSVLPFAERWNQPSRPRAAHPGHRRLDLARFLTILAGRWRR